MSFTVVLVSDVLDTTAPSVRTFAGCVVGAVVGTVVLPLLASSLSVPLSLSVVVSVSYTHLTLPTKLEV